MSEAAVAIKLNHGLLRELRGITVYVKGGTLVPLDFAATYIAVTNHLSLAWVKLWRVAKVDAKRVFLSGRINCIANATVWALLIRPGHPRVGGQRWAMLDRLRIASRSLKK